MSSQFGKNNSELNNPLKERIKLLMTAEELEKPYRFATRVGLSKGTFTGIWVEGRTSLQMKTAQKIADATGADPVWIMTGTKGKDDIQELELDSKPQKVRLIMRPLVKMPFRKSLHIAYAATEGALVQTFSMMPPDQKADFLVQYMKTIYKDRLSLEKAIHAAIFTIEMSLYNSRQEMSLEDKIQLILNLYDIYYKNPEVLKTALIELEEYRKKENQSHGDDNSDQCAESD